MSQPQVLIAGAGPTGLVSALWLTAQGVNVRIIDKSEACVSTSRALAVHARTLELYRQMGLPEAVIQHAVKSTAMNIWTDSAHAARIAFEAVGKGRTPYPYVYIYPQYEHERMLEERLKALGVLVERRVELLSFSDHDSHVEARLRGPDGQEESFEASYILGCDGGGSAVRHTLDIGFSGGTYPQVFFVADIEGTGPTFNGEAHTDLNESDMLISFPLSEDRHARLAGTVSDERADRPEQLTFADVSHRAIDALKINVEKVNWFSTYRVHHRVADHFRKGRAFLVGDAAHIHSPTGGQGMNTGIGDAINLAWKIAAVLQGRADESLLDTYEAERRPFAQILVETTDTAFTHATSSTWSATFVRKWVLPYLLPVAIRIPVVPKFIFSRVSQMLLNYRQGPLAQGVAGWVYGGDRLPWAVVNGVDNFTSLNEMTWQVHVYGTANDELVEWCRGKQIPLHVFAWANEYHDAGFVCDAAYLIRPDTYVAMVEPSGVAGALDEYLSSRGIRLTSV